MADVPILRPDGNQQRMTAWPASLGAIPHRIDPNGLVGITPEGQALARGTYMDGEQLLAAIAGVVRHELAREGAECAVPGCGEAGEATLTMGLGEGQDALAVNVWLCAEHGQRVDQTLGNEATGPWPDAPGHTRLTMAQARELYEGKLEPGAPDLTPDELAVYEAFVAAAQEQGHDQHDD